MKTTNLMGLAALALAPLLSSCQSGAASALSQPAQASPATTMKASALVGMEVRDRDSGATGRIDELVVDIGNNRVHYAVLDMRHRLLTQPLQWLEFPPGRDYALLTASGNRAIVRRSGMSLMRASKLIGAGLENEPGVDLGEVTDLVVERETGRIPFAVVRLHEAPAGRLHAVPLDALETYARRENLVVDASSLRPL